MARNNPNSPRYPLRQIRLADVEIRPINGKTTALSIADIRRLASPRALTAPAIHALLRVSPIVVAASPQATGKFVLIGNSILFAAAVTLLPARTRVPAIVIPSTDIELPVNHLLDVLLVLAHSIESRDWYQLALAIEQSLSTVDPRELFATPKAWHAIAAALNRTKQCRNYHERKAKGRPKPEAEKSEERENLMARYNRGEKT